MAKDKRLLICRSIIIHAQRLISEKKIQNQLQAERYPTPEDVPVWMEFAVPPKLLTNSSTNTSNSNKNKNSSSLFDSNANDRFNNVNSEPSYASASFSLEDKSFLLPHSVVARTGRSTVLFVANDVALDCAKINKRYNLFDAVISLDSIINDEKMGPKKASIAAATFSRFVFDERVASNPRLPRCLKQIALKIAPHQNELSVHLLGNLTEERTNNTLIFTLKQAGEGTRVEILDKTTAPATAQQQQQQQISESKQKGASASSAATTSTMVTSGAIRVRIGHAGMTAGAVTENGKEFLKSLRADFPQIARSIQVVNLTTAITRPIQWMELQISR